MKRLLFLFLLLASLPAFAQSSNSTDGQIKLLKTSKLNVTDTISFVRKVPGSRLMTSAEAGKLAIVGFPTLNATNFADAQTKTAALPVGQSAIVVVAADDSPGNAGTGPSGSNPETYYLYCPGVGLIQQVTYPK